MTPKFFTLHRRMMVLCAVCCFALSAFCQTFTRIEPGEPQYGPQVP